MAVRKGLNPQLPRNVLEEFARHGRHPRVSAGHLSYRRCERCERRNLLQLGPRWRHPEAARSQRPVAVNWLITNIGFWPTLLACVILTVALFGLLAVALRPFGIEPP